jgi:transcription-repair coupling factor (superfamily II helicase)
MHSDILDSVVNDFYDGQFNILISTSIVESGLDIPDANTIIVYRANMFGLSQLHQLRGRVGRGEIKGFAYLFTNPVEAISENAVKRLQAIQDNQEIGSGFAISSSDMDIRGSGNLIGDEQSGHIRGIGVELYNQILAEEVAKAKENYKSENFDFTPDVKLNISTSIGKYITDTSSRLYYYRKINSLREKVLDELDEKFGKPPQEIHNLIEITKIKEVCKKKKIISLEYDGNLNISFYDNVYKNPDLLLKFVKEKKAKFLNQNVIGFFIDKKDLIKETYRVLEML